MSIWTKPLWNRIPPFGPNPNNGDCPLQASYTWERGHLAKEWDCSLSVLLEYPYDSRRFLLGKTEETGGFGRLWMVLKYMRLMEIFFSGIWLWISVGVIEACLLEYDDVHLLRKRFKVLEWMRYGFGFSKTSFEMSQLFDLTFETVNFRKIIFVLHLSCNGHMCKHSNDDDM